MERRLLLEAEARVSFGDGGQEAASAEASARLVASLFAENFELLALEPQGFVALFAAAQGEGHFHEILQDDDSAVEQDFRCVFHFPDHLGEHGGEGEEEVFAGDVGEGHPGGVFGEIADVFDAGAVIQPLLIGALPPLGQVLLGDEPVLEEPFHVMSHCWIAVEPTEDLFGGHVVHDLVIELLSYVKWETGDFAFSCGHMGACGFAVCAGAKAETLKR
jgi:hypothetical protein